MFNLIRNLDGVTRSLVLLNLFGYGYNLYKNGASALWGINGQQALDIGAVKHGTDLSNYLMSMFMHGSLSHLLINMMMLMFIGGIVRNHFGIMPYIATYFGSGFIGELSSAITQPETAVVGASGAIFGLMGMLIVGVFLNNDMLDLKTSVIAMVAINMFYPYLMQFLGMNAENISIISHFTGLSTGVIGTLIIMIFSRKLLN